MKTDVTSYLIKRVLVFLMLLIATKQNAQAICNAEFVHYSVSNPDSVHFYPTSSNATSWYWSFGDGNTSTDHIPWHYYAAPGTYYVCLTIVDSAGTTCDWCDSVHVGYIPPPCNAEFAHYSISNPDSLHFYPTGSAATSWYWSFGDGTTSNDQYPWHYYSTSGTYYVCLIIVDSAGTTCDWCDSVHVG
ncbi:MAG: PKD domain-containing protein, partial [Bacteroidia bacterium]